MVCLHNGGTDFIDIVTGVLQGDTWTSFIFKLPILCTRNVNRCYERKQSHIKKARSRQNPVENVTHADYKRI